MYLNKRMYLCLSDANQPTASSEPKIKPYRKSNIQIAYENEKLDTKLSQNASQNLRQTICNTHIDFQILASIITERFDNTLNDQSSYYLRGESKKESQEETTQNKADKLLASL